jgi:hypothetical protein
MAYTFHRIFCGAPLDVQAEHDAFYEVMGNCNEHEAMPKGVLLVAVSITPTVASLASFQNALDENIRACRHYVQVLGESWGPPGRNFEASFELAAKCAADPAMPMREVALLWKADTGGRPVDPAVVQVRQRSADWLRVSPYFGIDSFKEQLHALLTRWVPEIPPPDRKPF